MYCITTARHITTTRGGAPVPWRAAAAPWNGTIYRGNLKGMATSPHGIFGIFFMHLLNTRRRRRSMFRKKRHFTRAAPLISSVRRCFTAVASHRGDVCGRTYRIIQSFAGGAVAARSVPTDLCLNYSSLVTMLLCFRSFSIPFKFCRNPLWHNGFAAAINTQYGIGLNIS